MKTINVPSKDQVSEQSQQIFDAIKGKMGKVPNLYATIGYSANALKGILEFDEAFAHTTFTAKEREGINLLVSQINNCDYCLAAHTMLAGLKGISSEEIIELRKGISTNSKFQTALNLAKSIAENKGAADPSLKDAFFDAGYTEAALIDLIGIITVRTFTNYVYTLTEIPIDFPAAPAL
ncbi:carboxymuconolactone decarboxylase family protein [Flavobacterium sp. WLB]|uniref:carboxymuconolactone decarboxylase family protein n=1 Tax=unclassified Flavobacterium TaxID=196869 RepID=UPI0006AB9B0D|nr:MULTISPECIES: carboxymuconolactone decarboxylase family protein [unclassified Flavobacterium]KOP39812.1 alkylhydroperoxidase [Flavobacterium sp. VMW]OWU92600.1 alkylhydroperoxidase [Flavobacterium sp. NLM]PUU68773.1 carboxymuconolactone decarboxylase family protein [Flavobacterium sp. WLB]